MTLSLPSASAPSPGPLAPHECRPDAGPAFVLPGYACFACADTGIVGNSDRAINKFISNYDVLPSGEVFPGLHPAIICCCSAAYPREGRGGYRDSAGPCRVETTVGPRKVGIELDLKAIETIHRNRRQSALAAVQATAEQARKRKANTLAAVAGLTPSMPGSL